MPRSVGNARDYDYLRLLAQLLWQPGVQRRRCRTTALTQIRRPGSIHCI